MRSVDPNPRRWPQQATTVSPGSTYDATHSEPSSGVMSGVRTSSARACSGLSVSGMMREKSAVSVVVLSPR